MVAALAASLVACGVPTKRENQKSALAASLVASRYGVPTKRENPKTAGQVSSVAVTTRELKLPVAMSNKLRLKKLPLNSRTIYHS